jgi:hypothetical protein
MSTKQDKQAGERTHKSYSLERWLTGGAAYAKQAQGHTPVFCHDVKYTDGETLSVSAVTSKPRETIHKILELTQHRAELLAALRLVYNDKGARFGVDKATNVPISEIVRTAIAKAEGSK